MSNKYNEVMNKIEVTEEMRNRILQNIANEFSEDNSVTDTATVETPVAPVETPIDFGERAKNRKKSVYSFTRYIGVAAAAVVLLIGASAVLDNEQITSKPAGSLTETAHEITQGAAADLHQESEFIKNSWVKYESVEKMAQATGTDFAEIDYLNDISSDVDYYLDGGNVATIVYDVSGNAITVTQKQTANEVAVVEEAEAPTESVHIIDSSAFSEKNSKSDGKSDSKSDKVSETVTVNGVDVRLEGTEEGFNKASWTVNGIDYSMDSADKISLDDMQELMKNIIK